MKALVLAGGSGTRLRPLTHTSAKQLVPVANKPILFYVLEGIADAGVTDVGVIVGETADEIREAVGDGSRFGISVTYLPQHQPLGLAHAVRIARDWLGEDDFVMYLGDNFLLGGINEQLEEFRTRRPAAQIMLTQVPDPSAFGVVTLDEAGRVTGLEEKPEFPKSDLALVGVYFFTAAVHDAVDAIKPSARGELEITDAIQWLLDQGLGIASSTVNGYWKDTGNATDMLEANRSVLDGLTPYCKGSVDDKSELVGRVVVEDGAVITRSRIMGPAVIGRSTRVEDSYIGPFTSVAEDCVVVDSEIEYSIVLAGAAIDGVRRIEASMIGRQAQVTPAPRTPQAHRLILGDHSKVQIRS
ncbi:MULTISPECIES: glucose-1-phosphate thymidylyltransferase [Streptomyces]|uniref:Glucose-1-phosphate thymidylyltransferase n=1 Tax=Streptomyces spororaveus TaxID=284039 RepID=A0ABQ3TA40_9ACTN|nr:MULTISPECIES: glucose-1-phosphate thymidylyltransferase [Streptomyces]MCM9082286.1 glucose-1-phosphate thymidylyltransferase [Streptomyces spororaveus]MCX5303277.1 glucose-1-phosphate thymidylyltransferase [Streptomyces sp. NBC_00160]GHI77273.1 glucose-1-phosphate thymidylyltransferase [Streptomyces spororaveus]